MTLLQPSKLIWKILPRDVVELTLLSGGEVSKNNQSLLVCSHLCICIYACVTPCLKVPGICWDHDWEMCQSVALVKQGNILWKFTANLNLMYHSLSFVLWPLVLLSLDELRTEPSVTSEMLVGRWMGLCNKRSQCQRAKGMTCYRVRHAALSKRS